MCIRLRAVYRRYNNHAEAVEIAGQGWYNDYTGISTQYGPFSNYNFGAGIHVLYGSNDVPISNLNPSNNVVGFNHGGGHIGISHQIPYSPSYCSGDLTYTLYYVNTTDNDHDGLLDYIEDMGFYDGNYNFYRTNSSNPDTDGDLIPDGTEVKTTDFWIVNGFRYYNLYSDPTKNDTDGDNLTDYQELCEIGTDPWNKDTDHDGWNDGDEIQAVNWPMATDPLKADTDGDGVIDSIDPDPLDPTNHTLPLAWHASEFAQGLLLGDINSGDPRHQDAAFETGQFISQFVAIGNARDLIVQANQGKKGPELLMLAVGCIPGEGTIGVLGKDSFKAASWLAKVDNVAEKTSYASKYLIDAKLLGKGVPSDAFAEKVFNTEFTSLTSKGLERDTIGSMAERGVTLQKADQTVDIFKSKGLSSTDVNTLYKTGDTSEDSINVMANSMSGTDAFTSVAKTTDGTTIKLTKNTIKTDVSYVGDAQSYVHDTLGLPDIDITLPLDNAKKGLIGETAAKKYAESKGYIVLGPADGFRKSSTFQQGLDIVCWDPATSQYVIIEAKFTTQYVKDVDKNILKVTDSGYRELDDNWIPDAVDRMERTTDSETGLPLLDKSLGDKIVAAHDAHTLRRELTVIQAGMPQNGYTIAENLADTSIGLDNVNLIKIGTLGR